MNKSIKILLVPLAFVMIFGVAGKASARSSSYMPIAGSQIGSTTASFTIRTNIDEQKKVKVRVNLTDLSNKGTKTVDYEMLIHSNGRATVLLTDLLPGRKYKVNGWVKEIKSGNRTANTLLTSFWTKPASRETGRVFKSSGWVGSKTSSSSTSSQQNQ